MLRPVPTEPEARARYTFHRPAALPELKVLRVTSDGPLSRSFPDSYSTVLHVAGRSDWSMRSARWSSAPGMIGVKIPGEVYAERARAGVAQFQVVKFDDALIEDARAMLGCRLGAPKHAAVDGRDPRVQPLAALHRRLFDDGASRSELEQDLCEAVSALIELVSVERAGMPLMAASAAVARARALLDARLTETVTLGELAAHARLDKFHLCRAFRAEIGLPPHAYVTYRRISSAQALLARGLPQAEVAASVGLYDQSQLHRHFKRILGVTPGAYAQAMR
jgi:AraC-like DNA-binding protein